MIRGRSLVTPVALDVGAPLTRVHCVLRAFLAVHAVVLNLILLPDATRPGLLVAAMVVLVGWTVLTCVSYRRRGPVPQLLVADLVVTILLTLATPLLRPSTTPGLGETVTGYWLAAAPLALAIAWGWGAGLASGVSVAAAAWIVAGHNDLPSWGSALILTASGGGLGYLVDELRGQRQERDAYHAKAAALAERERLNRIVHDGVLQVLAMVEREGRGLGPRGTMLAAAAREQESALRALVQDKQVDVTVDSVVGGDTASLTAVLDRHASGTVSISVLADDVVLPSRVVEEVDYAVSEILHNVAKHAGPDARAFVLLEVEDDDVVLSIRDNGAGATREQVLGAGARGRLGVQDSICGRIADLGGTATLTTAPGRGVEWELRIPKGHDAWPS